MKKCKIIKKYWWILLLLLVIPVGLNFLLGIEVKCKVIGDASDWLGFWAAYVAIIVSTAMVILTYKSLQQNKKNFIDQEKRYNDQANRHNLEISLARAQKSYEDICEKGKKLNQFGLYSKIFEYIPGSQDNKKLKGNIESRLLEIKLAFKTCYQDFDHVVTFNNMIKEDDKSKEYYDLLCQYYLRIQFLFLARNNIPQDIEIQDINHQKDDIDDYLDLYIYVDEIKDEIRKSGKPGYVIDTIIHIIDKHIIMSSVDILVNEEKLTDCVNKVIHDVGEELTKCREKLGVRF